MALLGIFSAWLNIKDISKISLFKDGRFAAQLQQALQDSKPVDVTA
jgi:hypothetical protein